MIELGLSPCFFPWSQVAVFRLRAGEDVPRLVLVFPPLPLIRPLEVETQ